MWGCYRTALDVKDWLTDASRLPMSELLLQGQHQYLETEELRMAVMGDAELRNFFELDVNELQARLNTLPWVAQVSVRKMWPNKIKVYLTEQEVAARWNGNRFVNNNGEIFVAPDRVKAPLMRLSGPDDQAVKVLEESRRYQSLLAAKGYKVLGVNLTSRHAWELTLDGDIKLFVGRSDIAPRLQRFIDAFPVIEPRELVAYVDLRYDTGMAVGWKISKETVHDQHRR
ncbi:cell division protein FtsQ [Aeromonas cavernicola]|uniref:Cell division protein FtsQ n=1 Tax=Aeromonas cavernicola TaxID=1006623 RepID=A0A2H9U7D8_9GAMM|nr:cell division protein FtsQ [Aeromonas cavernicola]